MAAFEAIASTTLGSTTSTVTFSSIPSTYEHLQLRLYLRAGYSNPYATIRLRLNSDSGSNYTNHWVYGNGSGVSASGNVSETAYRWLFIPAATGTSNAFGCAVIEILDYATTSKYTTIRGIEGQDQNTSGYGYAFLHSSLWLNTAAVTTLTFTSEETNGFVSGSVFALYGLRSS
jgi:hypothetical protein